MVDDSIILTSTNNTAGPQLIKCDKNGYYVTSRSFPALSIHGTMTNSTFMYLTQDPNGDLYFSVSQEVTYVASTGNIRIFTTTLGRLGIDLGTIHWNFTTATGQNAYGDVRFHN